MLKKSLILLIFGLLIADGSPHFAGMGNSGVAYGAHASSAFVNPALVVLDSNKASLFMSYDRNLDEVKKLFWAASFPVFKKFKIGFTYRSYSIDRIPMVGFDDLYGGYGPVAETISYTNYKDSTFGLLFAYQFKNFLIFQNPALGLTLKQYQGNFSNLNKINKAGQDFDLGFYSKINNQWAVGISCKDVGKNKLTWSSGQKENIDAVYTIGTAFDYQEGLKLLLDLDFFENENYPDIFHAGIDIKANQYFSCRLGLDCFHYSLDGGQTQKIKNRLNIGLAMSLLDNGLIIDYAYLQNDGFMQEGSHLISLSWFLDNPWNYFHQTTANHRADSISHDFKVIAPNNAVTNDSELNLEIFNNLYRQVTINNQVFALNNGKNIIKFPLQSSENIFSIQAGDTIQTISCFRLPQVAKNPYSVEQLVLAGDWLKRPYRERLSIESFSKYLLEIVNQNISQDLLKVFSVNDILITSGIYPQDISRYQYVTRGLFAEVIIKLTGNEHIYNLDNSQKAAADFLIKSELIYPEVLMPLDSFISEREIIFWLATICKTAPKNLKYSLYYILPFQNKLYVTFLNKNLIKSISCDGNEIKEMNILNSFDITNINEVWLTDIYDNKYLVYSADLMPKKIIIEAENKKTKNVKPTKSLADQMKVYIKTNPQKVKIGDTAVIYVGLTNNDNTDNHYLITAVFANQKKVTFKKIGTRLYKATLLVDKNLPTDKFKVFIKDKNTGQYFYKTHE